jgi:cell division protein FtsQ
MKIKRRQIQWGVALALGVLVLIGLIAAGESEKHRVVHSVDIRIEPDTGLYFISREDILLELGGGPAGIIGKPLSSIRLERLESSLSQNPFIAQCEVYADLAGKVSIRIKQKQPLLRVITKNQEHYYLGKQGEKIPFHEKFTAHVPVASGNIYERFTDSNQIHTATLQSLHELALFMHARPAWQAQIEQVYVDNYSDLILIPRVGNHSIVLGSTEKLAEKMEKLRVFYRKALPVLGWDEYSRIDLRYEGQVIGVRRDGSITTTASTQENNTAH